MPEAPSGWRYRPARRQDLARLAAIEARVHVTPWSRAQMADCLNAGHAFWLCESEKEGEGIVAYGVVSTVLDEASLLNICVDTPWQGRGLGRALLLFLLEQAREQDMKRMFLEVRASNARAISLYESCGFRQVGRRKHYYGGPQGREDALVYSAEFS